MHVLGRGSSMTTYNAQKYLARFTCLQGDCTDTCCSGLHVGITEDNYVQLKKTLSVDDRFKERAEQFITISPATEQDIATHPAHFGAILQDPDKGLCSFVDDEGGCDIHATFGEETIGDVCSLYPRTIAEVNDDVHIFASMACPEIARLVVTADDAFDDADLDPDQVPRHRVHRTFQFDDHSSLYERAFHHINALVDFLLRHEDYPVDIRLVFVVTFGDIVNGGGFRRGALHEDAFLLEDTLAAFQQKETLDKIEANYRALSIPGEYGLLLARNVFVARLRQQPAKNFTDVVNGVLFKRPPTTDELASFFDAGADHDAFAYSPEELWGTYAKNRAKLLEHFQSDINRYALHFIRHQWMTQWYSRSSSLPFFNAQTLVRLALARALLYLHPKMNAFFERVDAGDDRDGLVEQLNEMAVESFHLVGKNIMHVPSFTSVVDAFIREQGLDELSRTVLLLPP